MYSLLIDSENILNFVTFDFYVDWVIQRFFKHIDYFTD